MSDFNGGAEVLEKGKEREEKRPAQGVGSRAATTVTHDDVERNILAAAAVEQNHLEEHSRCSREPNSQEGTPSSPSMDHVETMHSTKRVVVERMLSNDCAVQTFRFPLDPRGNHCSLFDSLQKSTAEDLAFELFKLPARADGREEASIGKLLAVLRSYGLRPDDDPRLKETTGRVRELIATAQEVVGSGSSGDAWSAEGDYDVRHHRLGRQLFRNCVHPCISLITQALRNRLIIPNWQEFTAKIKEIFEECRAETCGQVASYIPQLARADPHKWGMSICTIDGQRFSLGDSNDPFCVQSVSKAFNYAIVASDLGADYVHEFVGHEPSGRLFNEICLDSNGKPHNPMINSGAIIVTSLLKKGLAMADRYDFAFNEYRKLAGGTGYVGFNNATFLSERYSADRNYALSYYMKENKCFPPDIMSLREELDFYFQLCSLETHCESAAVMAATLANGGVCPLTNEKCIDSRPCRDVLSLMYSCGMYDYSGQFAFHVGLPAKSGVSGAMIVVIPNLMGICLWSPPLDKMGNTARGVLFCQKLIETFNFHNYDSLLHAEAKKMDPRRKMGNKETDLIVTLLYASKNGDLETIRRLFLQGVDMQLADYDGRTALHLAACEGHLLLVKFLLHIARVDHNARDRWGRTALDDARTFHQTSCMAVLLKASNRRVRIGEDRRLVSLGERVLCQAIESSPNDVVSGSGSSSVSGPVGLPGPAAEHENPHLACPQQHAGAADTSISSYHATNTTTTQSTGSHPSSPGGDRDVDVIDAMIDDEDEEDEVNRCGIMMMQAELEQHYRGNGTDKLKRASLDRISLTAAVPFPAGGEE